MGERVIRVFNANRLNFTKKEFLTFSHAGKRFCDGDYFYE